MTQTATPRNRTRSPRNLGLPSAARSRTAGGFNDPVRGVDDSEVPRLAPITPIDALVQRYAGRPIPLHEAFPEPPPPPADHPALDRAVRASAGRFLIAPREPARDHTAVASEEAYRKEHMLRTAHRMLMRRATMAQIAQALNLTVGEAYRLRDELFRRVRAEGGSIDMVLHAGMTIGFYDEVRAIALRNADLQGTTHTDKARYLTIALGAENSKHRFLQVAGFYDNARLSPQDTEARQDDGVAMLQGAMRALFDPDAEEDELMNIDVQDRDTTEGHADGMIRVL